MATLTFCKPYDDIKARLRMHGLRDSRDAIDRNVDFIATIVVRLFETRV